MNKKAILTIFFLILLALIAVGAQFLYTQYKSGNQYSSTNTPTAALKQNNADFATADSYLAQKSYTQAIQYYQKALTNVSDPVLKSQIQYDIALATQGSGDYIHAIQLYKAIAADQNNSSLAKAYAVQQLGMMYYAHQGTDRTAIVNETFKDAPYNSFKAGATASLAYRKLFEYAASLSPLGYSEAWIAYWYANDVASMIKSTTTPQAVSEISIVNQSITKADADVERTGPNPYVQGLNPSVNTREALALSKLASLGAATPAMVEQYFQKAVQSADVLGSYGYERYAYAKYLAATAPTTRASDITNMLSVFSTKNTAKINQSTVALFTTARTDSSLANDKKALIQLAHIDPDFKTYLISLGWHEADFK